MTETPIFDAVLRDHGLKELPPPLDTHEEFLYRRGHDVWLDKGEMILRGLLSRDTPPPPTPIKRAARKRKPLALKPAGTSVVPMEEVVPKDDDEQQTP